MKTIVNDCRENETSEWFRTRLSPPLRSKAGPGRTLGSSKKCVPTENPEERVA
jgi:hypothetical protein